MSILSSCTTLGKWTWVSGDNTANQQGVYGDKGVAARTNKPGSRHDSISWVDSKGNLWLFGGNGYDSATEGWLSDLWKFDGRSWTWISGDNTVNQHGIYGDKGVAAGTNKPGSRHYSISWVDGNGNLWLFGGYGYGETGVVGSLNDLWKFDGRSWTWVSGDSTTNQPGVYGEKGVAAGTNKPGGHYYGISWIDSKGNLWLFGGKGYNTETLRNESLNDLWKFDGKNWTWVSGDSRANQPGVYGDKGVAAGANKPCARYGSISWIDSKDNLWLFGGGGAGYEEKGTLRDISFNDLWKFDSRNWTWVSGDNTADQPGIYGAKGITAGTNKPGARYSSISWIDSKDHLWLFGGAGKDDTGSHGYLNDLWKFDGRNWTWVSGDNTANQHGVYGVKGVAAGTNKPGGRHFSISWIDSKDHLWLFGGYVFFNMGELSDLNDLWKFKP